LISRYIGALKLVDPAKSSDGASVEIGQAERDQTTILKQLTWHYVIRRSDLATSQHGQRKMIESLFMVFKNAIEAERWELFPLGFSPLIRANLEI
jgi:dGTP triphosphohydrolase